MGVKFGDRMMQARKDKDLSREEFAEKVGTSAPIIGRYERGDMMPSVEIATKISEAPWACLWIFWWVNLLCW